MYRAKARFGLPARAANKEADRRHEHQYQPPKRATTPTHNRTSRRDQTKRQKAGTRQHPNRCFYCNRLIIGRQIKQENKMLMSLERLSITAYVRNALIGLPAVLCLSFVSCFVDDGFTASSLISHFRTATTSISPTGLSCISFLICRVAAFGSP